MKTLSWPSVNCNFAVLKTFENCALPKISIPDCAFLTRGVCSSVNCRAGSWAAQPESDRWGQRGCGEEEEGLGQERFERMKDSVWFAVGWEPRRIRQPDRDSVWTFVRLAWRMSGMNLLHWEEREGIVVGSSFEDLFSFLWKWMRHSHLDDAFTLFFFPQSCKFANHKLLGGDGILFQVTRMCQFCQLPSWVCIKSCVLFWTVNMSTFCISQYSVFSLPFLFSWEKEGKTGSMDTEDCLRHLWTLLSPHWLCNLPANFSHMWKMMRKVSRD